MKRRKYAIFLIVVLLAGACAKQGFPTGGPKDETPPKVLGATPPSGSTGWTGKEFSILFDEYVSVKDADKNILISPPMATKPEFGTKGRAVVVKLKDSLRANATYLFQFKGAIVDFNEGNPLESYEYVFATGSSIDSMTLRGQVLDALTHRPYKSEGGITVVAYGTDQIARFDSVQCRYLDSLGAADSTYRVDKTSAVDSIAAKEKPMYMTRCDQEGRFEMNHLREGHYRVLAFEDGDNNLLLKAGEAVAFLDTLVLAEHMPPPPDTAKADTSKVADSVAVAADTASGDSALASQPVADSSQRMEPSSVRLNISLFKEEAQRLAKVEFVGKGRITLATVMPLTEHFTLRPLSTAEGKAIFIQPNAKRDTLNIWTQDKNCDSITLLLDDKDIHDTLRLVYRAPKPSPSAAKMVAKGTPKTGVLLSHKVAQKHPYYDTLWIAFERPVRHIVYSEPDSLVEVFDLGDSITTHCGVRWADSCMPYGYYRAMIDFKGKAGGKYRFKVPAMSFEDIYGAKHHDSLTFSTEFTKVEEYGNIILTVDSVQLLLADTGVLLVQLLNEKGEVQRQQHLHEDGRIEFRHLKGGKYALRTVVDRDSNGTWTAGNYWKHRQPEEVYYFEKVLELRENWDMEERWTLKSAFTAMPQMGANAEEEKGKPQVPGGKK